MKKLIEVAVEYNIGKSTLIAELKNSFPNNDYSLFTILNFDELNIIDIKYRESKILKDTINEKKNNKTLNPEFSFTNSEQKTHKDIVSYYNLLVSQISLIEKKEKQYWALREDELIVLKELKLKLLREIQDDFLLIRQKNSRTIRIRESDTDAESQIMNALKNGEGDRFGL